MKVESTEVVRNAYHAFRAGDANAVLALSDGRMRIEDLAEGAEGDYASASDVRAFVEDRTQVWKRWGMRPQEFVIVDERVVVPVRLTQPSSDGARPKPTLQFHVWDVDRHNGKILRLRIYAERAQALDAAGRAG